MNESTNNTNEINIKFFPVITIKTKKSRGVKASEIEIPYEASVKVSGLKKELVEFFRWLISYCISHCARKYGTPIYRVKLEKQLDDDVSAFILTHYEDIMDSDIKQISLEFETSSSDPCIRQVLEDLEYKLQTATYVRNFLQRRFYDIQRGCNRYFRARLLGRDDDIATIMEIFKNPDRWYEFRDWKSPHDKYYI